MKLLFFSEYFLPIARILRFRLIVLGRAIIILFKANKKIRKHHLSVEDRYLFPKGNIVLKYDYSNALYYEIRGHVKTLRHQGIILNRSLVNSPLTLVVHGLFNKKYFTIPFNSKYELQNSTFTPFLAVQRHEEIMVIDPISRLRSASEYSKLKCFLKAPEIIPNRQRLQFPGISITRSQFNKTEFYEK